MKRKITALFLIVVNSLTCRTARCPRSENAVIARKDGSVFGCMKRGVGKSKIGAFLLLR